MPSKQKKLGRPHLAALSGSEGPRQPTSRTLPTAPDGAGKRPQALARLPQQLPGTKWGSGVPGMLFLYLMKNLPTFAEKPELWDDPYFNEFMEQATFASMTREEQDAYIASMKQKWDYKNTIDYAREEGREEGEENKAREIARRMLEDNEPMKKIVKFTGLSEEQIKAL